MKTIIVAAGKLCFLRCEYCEYVHILMQPGFELKWRGFALKSRGAVISMSDILIILNIIDNFC